MSTRRITDFFVLGGAASPGLLDWQRPFPGLNDPRMFDKRMGYGISEAWLFFRGLDLTTFSARFHVYVRDIDEFIATDADWQKFAAVVRGNKKIWGTGKSPSLQIVHFIPNELDVYSVVVTDERAWEQTSPGKWTKEIAMQKQGKPRPVLQKQFGALDRPKAQTSQEKSIQALGDQLAKLSERDR
jgi:hypothetical protein